MNLWTYTFYGTTLSHPKICSFPGGSGPPSNTWLLELTRAHMQNGILIGPAVFCRMHTRDRHTDTHTGTRSHTSLAIGRIYAMHTMRPKIRFMHICPDRLGYLYFAKWHNNEDNMKHTFRSQHTSCCYIAPPTAWNYTRAKSTVFGSILCPDIIH